MEPRDREENEGERSDERPGPDSSSQRGPAKAGAGSSAGPQVVGTNDPGIVPGPVADPDWLDHPDQTMAIETSRIRGPSEAFHPNFVVVPVEVGPPRGGRSGKGTEKGGDEGGDADAEDDGAKKDEQREGGKAHGKSGDGNKDQTKGKSSPPSLTRTLIFAGVVAMVCGVVGAWGYSHFFGSSKSGNDAASGKGSESGKGKGSGGSSKGSESGQGAGSDSSQNGEDQSKVHEAESAWMMAVKELHAAQAGEKAARHAADEKRSILDFFKKTLMSAGRSADASLSEAFWAGGPAKDVSFRKALDVTEAQVAETFGERPVAEAAVREMLGLGYLTVGDPAQAVKQYERAFALRQAVQGVNDPETAACRNQLAVAYRLAGRTVEGGRLFDRGPNSPAYASALAVSGSMLLAQKKPGEAELKLRECLTIRRKAQPNEWTTFDTESLLGEALLDQDRFADAEPLLLSGYDGIKQRASTIPRQDRPHLTKAIRRLIRLYQSWAKEPEALRWRKELEAATL